MAPLELLYWDNHLVVVNKPSGVVTHEDGVHSITLRAQVEQWVVMRFHKPGRAFVVPVHRLDAGTSGIVVFAKTDKALSRMMEQFRQRQVGKFYRVQTNLCCAKPGVWSDYLLRDERGSRVVDPSLAHSNGVALAQMRVSQLADSPEGYEWRVQLLTGRHHQIRLQFAARGMPVAGDRRYGGMARAHWPEAAIALHHERLECVHPVLRTPLVFQAPLPSYWSTTIVPASSSR